MVGQGRKGRPIGFRLSQASKRAISEAKKGQRHKERTKDKISKSLQDYFRKKNPLSDEIIKTYCKDHNGELFEWAEKVSDELNEYKDILTQKILNNKLRIELSYGDNIEEIFSHSMTPELLLMEKEYKAELLKRKENEEYEGEIR